jgi:hypothetical protein
MFQDYFRAGFQTVKIKRAAEDKGGGLLVDINIGAVLTQEMAVDLGAEIERFLDTELQFKSVTVDAAVDGLLLDVYHSGQDIANGPFLTIGEIATKKYKLERDEDTGSVIFSSTLKLPETTEDDIIRILQCLQREVTAKLQIAQEELSFE